MIIDWGDAIPTPAERRRIEERLRSIGALHRSTVALRRFGTGYEAHLRVPLSEHATEIRLTGEDAETAVARLLHLLVVVMQERDRTLAGAAE
jgi:hypothetical protein